MHETIIAKQIIDEANKHGKPTEITVEVGDLGHLPAHELEQCLKNLINCRIVVKNKKAVIKCSCGYKGEPKIIEKGHDLNIYECPTCKTPNPEILEGKDIKLVEVKTE